MSERIYEDLLSCSYWERHVKVPAGCSRRVSDRGSVLTIDGPGLRAAIVHDGRPLLMMAGPWACVSVRCSWTDINQLLLGHAGGGTSNRRAELVATNGRIKRLHVSQPNIRHNIHAATADKRPPLTIQTSAGPVPAWDVEIMGPSRLRWSDKPLSCGARVWLETTAKVVIHE